MEPIRLYALRVLALSLIFLLFFSCFGNEKKESNVERIEGSQEKSDIGELYNNHKSFLDGSENEIYLSKLVPVEDNEIIKLRYKFIQYCNTQHEILRFDTKYLYSYDLIQNSFLKKFRIETLYKEIFDTANDFYVIDSKIIKNYGEALSPNTGVAIYKHGDFYISLFRESRFKAVMIQLVYNSFCKLG